MRQFCIYGGFIMEKTFLDVLAQSPDAYTHEFSLATMAFVSNKKVRIYSYDSNDCKQANFIAI